MAGRSRRILERYTDMKSEKDPWNTLYEVLSEYVMQRRRFFTAAPSAGELETEDVFDDTASNANHLMASSIIGATWPNGAKSFRLNMPFDMEYEFDGDTEELKQYYQWATKKMAMFMDNPKAGLQTSLEEYMLDQGAFGISGMAAFEQDDFEVPIVYKPRDAKSICVKEGANGFVNTVYTEREFTVKQLVEEYGYENIGVKRQKEFNDNDTKTRVKVLHAIEPRMERDPFGFGVKNMPIASIHIDIDTEKILRESGYAEMPVAVTRFWKRMGEVQGVCPAMNALPSILEANALREATILAIEKNLDPPLAVTDDAGLGGGIIDTSPGAVTVVSVSGRLVGNQKPIEPLYLVGELNTSYARITELHEIIKNHFFQDRLMDLNNEQRMTLGEANIRDRLRGMSLNTVYNRQFTETYTFLIERTFNSLLRRGFLGVVPGTEAEEEVLARGKQPVYIPEALQERLRNDEDIYRIEFISPAIRIMQAEELSGIRETAAFAFEIAAVQQDVMDNLDVDWTIQRVQELTGAPKEMVESLDTVKQLRKARQAQLEAQAQIEADRQQSETARNQAQAMASVNGDEQQAA